MRLCNKIKGLWHAIKWTVKRSLFYVVWLSHKLFLGFRFVLCDAIFPLLVYLTNILNDWLEKVENKLKK